MPSRSSLSIARMVVRRFSRRDLRGVHRAVENFSIIHLHDVVAALDAQRFHRVRRQHAHLGVGRHARCAHGVGVELHELAEASRARLLVAEHRAVAIASDKAAPGSGNSPPRSARAARSDRSAATATARRRPGTRTRPRSAGPGRAGTCRARRCIRSPASPPARSRSARTPRGSPPPCAGWRRSRPARGRPSPRGRRALSFCGFFGLSAISGFHIRRESFQSLSSLGH